MIDEFSTILILLFLLEEPLTLISRMINFNKIYKGFIQNANANVPQNAFDQIVIMRGLY